MVLLRTLAAGLALPAVLAGGLALSGALPPTRDAPAPVAAVAPAPAEVRAGRTGGWGLWTYGGAAPSQGPPPVIFSPPPPPRPPVTPWQQQQQAALQAPTAEPAPRPVVLGPVQHVVRNVAPGAGLPLPATRGWVHLLCSGPTAFGSEYWLDEPGGVPTVHSYDGTGHYDFYYRVVSALYVQTKACA